MPYIGISSSSATVSSTISIAFGTYIGISASALTVSSRNDNGTINTSDSTSVISISQQGIGSLVISSTTLTVSAGVATTSFRGKQSGNVSLIATSPTLDNGTTTLEVSYNPYLYSTGFVGGGGVRPQGGGGGAGGALLRDTIKINNQTLYRIVLWTISGTKRGRGTISAIIHDAKNIGVSSYLNEGGEVFFTLPYNHPQIAECVPQERHYRIDRFDEEAGRYITLSQGLLEDYDATDNEVVFYGIDYMGVLTKTITTPSTTQTYTYTNKTFANIYQSEMTQAVTATNSRLGFIDFAMSTVIGENMIWTHTNTYPLVINSSTNTYSIYTGGEARALFIQNLANIAMAGTTTKVVFGNTLESDTELYNGFFCDMNWSPTPNNNIVLEYGGNVKSFAYSPNFRSLLTRSLLIATNSGATVSKIWSSIATGTAAPTSTYGLIDGISAAEDIKSQEAADARAAHNLYQSSPDKIKMISIAVKDGSIVPFKRYRLGDDIRVRIKRGIVNVDASITLRGQRYVGNSDGSESLWFDFFIRDTLEFNLYSSNNKPGSTGTKSGKVNADGRDPMYTLNGKLRRRGRTYVDGSPVGGETTSEELVPPVDDQSKEDTTKKKRKNE